MGIKNLFIKLLETPVQKREYGVLFEKSRLGWRPLHPTSSTKLLLEESLLEKSSGAQVGEIREWSGKKYKKTNSGKWVLVVESRGSQEEDSKSGDSSKVSDTQLSKYARAAKTESLKKHAEGADERMRIIAKTELERRQKEETPKGKDSTQERDETVGNAKQNEEKHGELSIDQMSEKLISEYKGIVEKLKDPEIFSNSKEVNSLTLKQKELARQIKRVKEFEGVDIEKSKEELFKKMNLSTDEDLQLMVGDGKVLGVKKTLGTYSFLTEECYCQRTFDEKQKIVLMDEFILNLSVEKGKGKGTEIFSNQVAQFREKGYQFLETTAHRDEIYNGYYTWAMLGYKMTDRVSLNQFKTLIKSSPNPRIQKCKDLSQLVSFKEGAEFWRKEGFTFSGVFDLREGSSSMKLLNNYIQTRKSKK